MVLGAEPATKDGWQIVEHKPTPSEVAERTAAERVWCEGTPLRYGSSREWARDDALWVEAWPLYVQVRCERWSRTWEAWDAWDARPGVRSVAESLTNAGRPRPGATWVAGAPLSEASMYVDSVFIGLAGDSPFGPRAEPGSANRTFGIGPLSRR